MSIIENTLETKIALLKILHLKEFYTVKVFGELNLKKIPAVHLDIW